jgi:hypothetical protein
MRSTNYRENDIYLQEYYSQKRKHESSNNLSKLFSIKNNSVVSNGKFR